MQYKILIFFLLVCILMYRLYQEGESDRNVRELADTYSFIWEEGTEAPISVNGQQTEKNCPDSVNVQTYEGVIDCVLEIPSIDLRGVVITGGNRQLNLDQHFFVAARETMQYGQGSYVIFGHQSFIRGVGFNRLDELRPGDCIYIVTEEGKTAYSVTEMISAHWGEDSQDFLEDETHLAIYTCKKQREYPKPYMIVRAVKNP